MKTTQEHVERLAAGVARCRELSPSAREGYRARELGEERFRWDLLHCMEGLDGWRGITSDLYRSGLKDSHIDTALRRAVAIGWD